MVQTNTDMRGYFNELGFSSSTSVIAAQQASAAGKFNQAIQNRNAQIKEQEAELIEKQSEFDLAQFDKKFARFQGETKTKILNSGVELSGSGLRILRANAEQAELEKDIMEYNAKINQARTFEQANFARMQGQLLDDKLIKQLNLDIMLKQVKVY